MKEETFDDLFGKTLGIKLYEKVDNFGGNLIHNTSYRLQTIVSISYGFIIILPTTIFTLIEGSLEALVKKYYDSYSN